MIRHRVTLPSFTGDGKTWMWFEGLESELERLREEALARWPHGVQAGLPDHNDQATGQSVRTIPYIMAFVFDRKEDAMVFKLSVA